MEVEEHVVAIMQSLLSSVSIMHPRFSINPFVVIELRL